MFTIKCYSHDGYRNVIRSAESFTILRDRDGEAEITLHQKNAADDCRMDIKFADKPREPGWPPIFSRAIIENAAGKTTEIIGLGPMPAERAPPPPAA